MGLLAIYLLPAAAAFFLFLKTLTDYRGLRARHFIPFIPSIIYAILLQIVSVLVYAIFYLYLNEEAEHYESTRPF